MRLQENYVYSYVAARTEGATSQHKLMSREELDGLVLVRSGIFTSAELQNALDDLVKAGKVIKNGSYFGTRYIEVL